MTEAIQRALHTFRELRADHVLYGGHEERLTILRGRLFHSIASRTLQIGEEMTALRFQSPPRGFNPHQGENQSATETRWRGLEGWKLEIDELGKVHSELRLPVVRA